jgi:hypothetical protein
MPNIASIKGYCIVSVNILLRITYKKNKCLEYRPYLQRTTMGTNGKVTHIWVDLLPFSSLSFMSLRSNHWCRNFLCYNSGCLWSYIHDVFTILQIIHVLVAYMHLGSAWTSIDYFCHFFPCRYTRFVLGLDGRLKFEPKFLMVWKFSAPPTTMYTPKIEAKWSPKHRGGGGWYLDMPKGIIPYEEICFS